MHHSCGKLKRRGEVINRLHTPLHSGRISRKGRVIDAQMTGTGLMPLKHTKALF